MKGFLVSPILLVGLILITGVIIINFSDIDSRIAEGISQESRVNKVLAQAFENKISTENLILFYGAEAAKTKATETEVENEIKSKLNAPTSNIKIKPASCGTDEFTVDYLDYEFKSSIFDVKIKRPPVISKTITCNQYKEIIGCPSALTCNSQKFCCP